MIKRHKFESMLGPAEDFPPGSLEWAERISNRLQLATDSLSRDTIHHLTRCIKQIWQVRPRPWEIWPKNQPFYTPDDYCQAVTGHSWKVLLELVKEMGNKQQDFNFKNMEAELARAQAEHRKQGTRTDLQHVAVSNKLKRGGTQSVYLLRRLARDYPSILQRYENGEFKSVRAAAKAAGIIKDPIPFKIIERLLPKLTKTECKKLRKLLDDLL
jgi:hypothetical protein